MMNIFRKFSLQYLLRFVSGSDTTELSQLMDCINQRYRDLYPNWEVIYLALPQNNKDERQRLLKKALSLIAES